jgi:predicted AAA+ superfamily ATPase
MMARWPIVSHRLPSTHPLSELDILHLVRKTMLKGHQYEYSMKDLDLGNKNTSFSFRFSCLFTVRKHQQQFLYILKKHLKDINLGIQ